MSTRLRLVLIAFASLVVLAILAAFLLSRVDAKSRFEAIVSEATGLEVAAKGGVSIGLFPTLHVALKEVTLRNANSQIASLGEADIGLAFWPLLRKQISVRRLMLRNVSVELERDRSGQLNFVTPAHATRVVPALSLQRLSIGKASFRYNNQQSHNEFTATDCNVDAASVQLAEGSSADIMEHLSMSAHFMCAEVRNDLFSGTDVVFSIAGDRGNFNSAPVTMQIMGGKGSGTIDADFTGRLPAYRVHYAVAQLHVDDLFKSVASGRVGEGMLDFTTVLSMSGRDRAEITRTAQGEASLRGTNLNIAIGNLDEKLAHYESSQNFNLVDIGAFFIVGPLGAAATKGYNFANIFQGTKGNTEIRTLISHWKVENGVAHAQDVAMATTENRVAMKGGLDFVNSDFDDVTVAILDHQGCARVVQKVHGSFSKPVVEKPNVLASLTGPISSAIGKAKKMLGMKCEVFYAGSVQP